MPPRRADSPATKVRELVERLVDKIREAVAAPLTPQPVPVIPGPGARRFRRR